MYKIMTPGPTQVRENVRLTRAMAATNPDLDPAFLDFYQTTCQKFARFLGASGQVYILGGEGILGLEAACASLTEPGDRDAGHRQRHLRQRLRRFRPPL